MASADDPHREDSDTVCEMEWTSSVQPFFPARRQAALVLAAVHDRRRLFQLHLLREPCGLASLLNGLAHLLGAGECLANILVFRRVVEGNQPVAVLTIDLKSVADLLRALAEKLRAFRAFDLDLLLDHEMPLN